MLLRHLEEPAMIRIKRVLVPTDFSRMSELALSYALSLAARDGAALHLLHVVDDAVFAAAYADGLYVELPLLRSRAIEDGERKLAAAAEAVKAANIDVTTDVVVGKPAACITQAAEQRGTDLIVMGTHGRSGLAHLMLGSVAERVLRMAPCPVMTVRDTARVADAVSQEADRPEGAVAV